MLNNLMDREPSEISSRIVEEIDDILNNPSDDDAGELRPGTGPGGSIAMPPI
jgi:hypothetical protein